MQLGSRRCEAPGPRIPQARGANGTLALGLLPPVPARPRAWRGTRPCSGPCCPPHPVGPPGHTVESSSRACSQGCASSLLGSASRGGEPHGALACPVQPTRGFSTQHHASAARQPQIETTGLGHTTEEHFGGNTRFFCNVVVHWDVSSCPPPGAGLLWSVVPGGCLRAPRALGCVSEVSASPCPASPPRCPPQAEPQGPCTAPAPPLYIAPAHPPPAPQVACGFVFLLPSRRRLCLRLSLSRTPHRWPSTHGKPGEEGAGAAPGGAAPAPRPSRSRAESPARSRSSPASYLLNESWLGGSFLIVKPSNVAQTERSCLWLGEQRLF